MNCQLRAEQKRSEKAWISTRSRLWAGLGLVRAVVFRNEWSAFESMRFVASAEERVGRRRDGRGQGGRAGGDQGRSVSEARGAEWGRRLRKECRADTRRVGQSAMRRAGALGEVSQRRQVGEERARQGRGWEEWRRQARSE